MLNKGAGAGGARGPVVASAQAGAEAEEIEEEIEAASQGKATTASEGKAGRKLFFCVSQASSRVHLYDSQKQPLHLNMRLEDISDPLATLNGIALEDAMRLELRTFVQQWQSLRPMERKTLYNQVVRTPLRYYVGRAAAAQPAATTSTLRFAPQSAQPKQASRDAQGAPLCAECSKPFPAAMADDYGQVYCSDDCRKAAAVRSKPGAARKELYSIEQGVCQACGLDAHALFERIKALEPSARLDALLATRFNTLGNRCQSMLAEPNEGMFWQGDHIKPVAEGGGESDMSNYRTLCTPCHEEATRGLRQRLQQSKRKASLKGMGDIRKMLGGGVPSKTARSASAERDDAVEVITIDD